MILEDNPNQKFTFEDCFSIQLQNDIKSNGSVRIFERNTHVMTSLFGPKENI